MSLINKMLHDLDARANAGGEAADLYTKPVARKAARPSVPAVAGLAVVVVAVSVGCALAWRYYHKQAPATLPAVKPAQVIMLGPQPQVPTPVAQASATAAPEPVPVSTAPEPREPHAASPRDNKPQVGAVASEPAVAQTKPAVAKPASAKRAEAEPAEAKPAEAKSAQTGNKRLRAETLASLKAESKVAAKARPAMEGKEETAAQKAEAAYRKALASLQDGWVSEAITSLEQALQANPKHEAARQTLVSLLMENKRYDEAMRQLQAALAADPRQPALAMLLARLQIERGGSGIDTLTRTLPYAAGNGEYHAFLGGALQRQGRNNEAASQYQAALRAAPQNGVWWMGLGMSLQGDKRDADALDAFRRAKANGLSPELQSFVDRKIQQLAR